MKKRAAPTTSLTYQLIDVESDLKRVRMAAPPPPRQARRAIMPGEYVKVAFEVRYGLLTYEVGWLRTISGGTTETKIGGNVTLYDCGYVGELVTVMKFVHVAKGAEVRFSPRHVLAMMPAERWND